MKVGLINIEPRIVNTAFMQIATYHKLQGDTVDWWSPLTNKLFDKIYCSSLFDYTDKSEIPKKAICGGTGFDVSSRLSMEVESCDYDYSIYPTCKKSFVWFSRGCIRQCPWCVVPEKEGLIRPVRPKSLNPKGKYIVIQDNNFFANPYWREAIRYLQKAGQPVDFQGVDARLLTKEMCCALNSLRHHKQIKIAWDNPYENLEPTLREIIQYIKPWRLMCYVLIGYWAGTEDADLERVEKLRELGIDPFVMPYNRSDLYERAFARWVNHKAIFNKVSWSEYRQRVEAWESIGQGWHRK